MSIIHNPFRKKTPDEINQYKVMIDLSNSYIKKVKRLGETTAKFVFSCKNPFLCNVEFATFKLDSLKSNFNGNKFKFKKFLVYADFEGEDLEYFMEENYPSIFEARRKRNKSLGQRIKSFAKHLRMNKIFKKIKKANKNQKYKSASGKTSIVFSYGGRHVKKFVPLPKKVTLWCSTSFSDDFGLNIGALRPVNEKDIKKTKETIVVFKSPELSKAIKKAMKFKVFGTPIKESTNTKISNKG